MVDAQKYSNIRSLGDSSDSKHHDDNDDIELQPLKAQDSDNPDESDNSATENDEARTGLTDERRGSASTTLSFQLYTPDEEQAVVRKFDRRLVLFVALLYMLSFLDRSS